MPVGFHPAFGTQPGETRQTLGHPIGLENAGDRRIDDRDAAGQVEQCLRLLEVQIDVARIQLAHAKFEDASDIDNCLAAFTGVQPQLVADTEAEVLGQLLADHRIACANHESSGNQVVGQGDDALIARRIDAEQRHRGARHAAPGDGRAADDR